MSTRFFARFNLQNSLAREHLPVRAEILSAMLGKSEDEIRTHLAEFEDVQQENKRHLKALFGEALEALHGKRVLFLGDSLTSDNLGYRTAVCRAAALDGIDGSVSGATSATLLGLAHTLIKKERPNILSLMIGANDSISIAKEGFCQVSLAEYSRNVRELVAWAKEYGAAIMLFEVTPVVEELFERNFCCSGRLQNERISAYNAALQHIAAAQEIALIPSGWLSESENMNELYESDGLHLSAKGQKAFAAKWISAATKII